MNESVCGLINSLITVDTQTMQQQFDDFMDTILNASYITHEELDPVEITSQLEDIENSKVSKPVTIVEDNILVSDIDGNAKDSGYSPLDLKNDIGKNIASISTYVYSFLGWSGQTTSSTLSTGYVCYYPIVVDRDFTITGLAAYHNNTTNSNLDVAIYSEVNGLPSAKLTNTYTIIGSTTTGVKETAVTIPITKGLYFVGVCSKVNAWSGVSFSPQYTWLCPTGSISDGNNTASITRQTAANLPATAAPTTGEYLNNVVAILFRGL